MLPRTKKESEVDLVISVSTLKDKLMRKLDILLNKPTLLATELKVVAEVLKDLDDNSQKTYMDLLQRTMGLLEESKQDIVIPVSAEPKKVKKVVKEKVDE